MSDLINNNDLRYYGNPINWESTKGDLISREALKKAICEKGIKGYEEYNQGLATALDLVDLAPSVDLTKNQAYDKGFITAMKLYARPQLDYKVINRGKCMLCGKELTEGLFFCKECEQKGGADMRGDEK